MAEVGPGERAVPERVRVARFDEVDGVDGVDQAGEAGKARVVDFDGLATAAPRVARVAALTTLAAPPVAAPPAAPPAAAPAGPATSGPGAAQTERRGRGERRRSSTAELDPEADPEAEPEGIARAICLRLLTVRARTRQELAQALRRKGVPEPAAHAVLERFDEVGLIDDAAFAEQWVRSRHSVRGLGRRALAVELRGKGVADEVAGEALAGLDPDAEERRARELVARKLRSLPIASAEQRTSTGRRLVGMLARKGYGGGVAYRVVREALAERGAELDELADTPDDG